MSGARYYQRKYWEPVSVIGHTRVAECVWETGVFSTCAEAAQIISSSVCIIDNNDVDALHTRGWTTLDRELIARCLAGSVRGLRIVRTQPYRTCRGAVVDVERGYQPPVARAFHAAVADDQAGRLFVLGGYNDEVNSPSFSYKKDSKVPDCFNSSLLADRGLFLCAKLRPLVLEVLLEACFARET